MKITAYEVRDDEKDYLKQEAEKYGIGITLVPGPLTEDTINLANGADGITILGETKLKEDLMQEVAKRQIKVVATRTIGYDHWCSVKFSSFYTKVKLHLISLCRMAWQSIRSC